MLPLVPRKLSSAWLVLACCTSSLFPGDFQFFGSDLRQGGVDPLAHLRLGYEYEDAPVGVDFEPEQGIERAAGKAASISFGQPCRCSAEGRQAQRDAQGKGGASRRHTYQEPAPADVPFALGIVREPGRSAVARRFAHAAPPPEAGPGALAISAAARSTARLIRP